VATYRSPVSAASGSQNNSCSDLIQFYIWLQHFMHYNFISSWSTKSWRFYCMEMEEYCSARWTDRANFKGRFEVEKLRLDEKNPTSEVIQHLCVVVCASV